MTRKEEKEATKRRILAVCVRLFLERGYHQTTLTQIVKGASVSVSSFQNIFGTKDGVLLELIEIMFDSQFASARKESGENLSPVLIYAVETAIQMTLTEINENIREVYVEAYSNPAASEYIYKRTSAEIERIFSRYNPEFSQSDFYELDIGTCGIMRNYMARKCDQYFTLEKKLSRFLDMGLKAYNVPQKEIDAVIAYVLGMDIKSMSNDIMNSLFETLAMRFNFEIK